MGRRVFIGGIVVFLSICFFIQMTGPAFAQKKEFRWADNMYNNRRTDYEGAYRMMDLIEERSKGQITFKRINKSIAGNLAQTTEAIQKGTLDIGDVWAPIVTMHSKAAGALIMPFLFNLPEDMLWNVTSPETRELLDVIEKEAGFKILTTGIYEERSFINNKRPIKRLEDVKGLRIRVLESPDEQYWVALTGARPGPSTFPELYQMLKTGVFDGYDGNFMVHESMKYYEVNKYISIMGYHYITNMFAMSWKAWNSLTPQEQKLFMDTAKEAVIASYPKSRRIVERARKVCEANGNIVNEVEDLDKWREVVKPAYERKMNESPAAKKFMEAVWDYHKKYPRWPTEINQPVPTSKWF
jgi:TRAP-type transport system periplasmic protein